MEKIQIVLASRESLRLIIQKQKQQQDSDMEETPRTKAVRNNFTHAASQQLDYTPERNTIRHNSNRQTQSVVLGDLEKSSDEEEDDDKVHLLPERQKMFSRQRKRVLTITTRTRLNLI